MAPAKLATTVVSTKGQVILPKAIRNEKNWAPGTKLVAESRIPRRSVAPERLFPRRNPKTSLAAWTPKANT